MNKKLLLIYEQQTDKHTRGYGIFLWQHFPRGDKEESPIEPDRVPGTPARFQSRNLPKRITNHQNTKYELTHRSSRGVVGPP
jgi:hypothetical protein